MTAERLHDLPFAPPADREAISRDDVERRPSSATPICSPAATVALLIPVVLLVIFAAYRAESRSTAASGVAPHAAAMLAAPRDGRIDGR